MSSKRCACLIAALFSLSACSGDGSSDEGSGSTAGEAGTSADTTAGTTTSTTADGSGSGSTAPAESSGSAGSEGSGSETGNTRPAPPCVTDRDCTVLDDCCTCEGVHVDDPPVQCDIDCKATMCEANGVNTVAECVLGSCQIVETTCDQTQVCEEVPPECPMGWLPEVEANCWTGVCVPAEACDVVPSCELCAEGEACLQVIAMLGSVFVCTPIPEECMGEPSCGCLPDACPQSNPECIDGPEGIECHCPTC